ncbi:hypothetical protein D6779_07220, partial [Candidatus Parcubacteria bacterium]
MINYVEKGIWLHQEIARQGHVLQMVDGVWQSDNDAVVQQIIDSFDPLPHARAEAEKMIDEAAGQARARYITVAPGQEATYVEKARQAEAFKAAGYPTPVDVNLYPLIDAEVQATGL